MALTEAIKRQLMELMTPLYTSVPSNEGQKLSEAEKTNNGFGRSVHGRNKTNMKLKGLVKPIQNG